MSESKKAGAPETDQDQGFNENELQDIMNEIESLEKEFSEDAVEAQEAAPEMEAAEGPVAAEEDSAFDSAEMQSIVDEVEALEASAPVAKVRPISPAPSSGGKEVSFSGAGTINFNMSFELGETPVHFSVDPESGVTLSMDHVEFNITEDSCVVKMPGGVTFNVPMTSEAKKKAA
ncbi:MAG: hypothetical protein Fur0010_25610 [Bdellovibrio sp.]